MSRPTFRVLIKQTVGLIRPNLGLVISLVALVVVPANLLSLGDQTDSAQSAYFAIANLVMTLALLWSFKRLSAGKPVSLGQAYYEGTAAFTKFFLVLTTLALQLIPLLAGAAVLAFGLSTPGASGWQKALIVLLAMLLAAPSWYWLPRYLFAVLEVDENTPVRALRASRLKVKGNYWWTLGRLILIGATLIALLIPPTLVLGMAYQSTQQSLFLALLQTLAALIFLPLFNAYLLKVYQSLDG
jgi:hypothetical protein